MHKSQGNFFVWVIITVSYFMFVLAISSLMKFTTKSNMKYWETGIIFVWTQKDFVLCTFDTTMDRKTLQFANLS